MKDFLLAQIEKYIHTFFREAKLSNKKWYKELKSVDELLYSFFVIRRRMIQPKKFTLHEAQHILDRDLKPEVLRDYEQLKWLLEGKSDLKKYHTKNSKILFPIDGLLEDWNINHVHLDRSRFQVFFMQENNELFLLNICRHFERNRTSFYKTSLLSIVEENWPNKLNKKRLPRHPKSTEKFPSSYGWRKADELYTWLDEISNQQKNGIPIFITFIDNECFTAEGIKESSILPFMV